MQKGAAAHGQRPRPLSQSLSALPAPPKWEPLAVHANSISLPRPLPLGEVSPQVTERASPLKKKHPQQLFADFLKSRSDCYRCFYFIRYYVMQKERLLVILFSVLRVIQMRLLQMLLLYTILRHAKGTSARNITLRPSGHPDARAVCVSMRRTAAAMQSTGCR